MINLFRPSIVRYFDKIVYISDYIKKNKEDECIGFFII